MKLRDDAKLCQIGRCYDPNHPTCRSCQVGCALKAASKPPNLSQERSLSEKGGTTPTEEIEQIALARWLDIHFANDWFHVPNGGQRNVIVGKKLKAQGVKPGVPDNFIIRPLKGCHGMVIELKRIKGGIVSPEQKEWLRRLSEYGWITRICKGAQEAIQTVIKEYQL